MNASQRTRPFAGTLYRDFALFALAAIGVGLAVSLTLATAVVLAAPGHPSAADTDKAEEHAAEGARIPGPRASIQHPRSLMGYPS